jgi:arylsulfatase A-like enzyme
MPTKAPQNARHFQPQDPGTSTRADYVAIMERADRGVGEILRALERLGLARNTLVIFTNDNGGEWLSRNTPLFHRKQTLWEGGIRVPALARWPGRIPAASVSGQVGITMDLSATILAATGTPVPAAARFEGLNLLPILEGRAPVAERTLFWRTTGQAPQRVVRRGDWKLMVDAGKVLLYDVRTDLGERNDLASQRQDIAQALRPLITAWEADVDAEAGKSGDGGGGGRGGRGRGGRGAAQ